MRHLGGLLREFGVGHHFTVGEVEVVLMAEADVAAHQQRGGSEPPLDDRDTDDLPRRVRL